MNAWTNEKSFFDQSVVNINNHLIMQSRRTPVWHNVATCKLKNTIPLPALPSSEYVICILNHLLQQGSEPLHWPRPLDESNHTVHVAEPYKHRILEIQDCLKVKCEDRSLGGDKLELNAWVVWLLFTKIWISELSNTKTVTLKHTGKHQWCMHILTINGGRAVRLYFWSFGVRRLHPRNMSWTRACLMYK